MFNLIKSLKLSALTLATLGIFLLSGYTQSAQAISATDYMEGGDFFQAYNNTTQEGTWRDPVNALPRQIIEYRIRIHNTSDQRLDGIQVFPRLSQAANNVHVADAMVRAQNYGFGEIHDTATVNITNGARPGMSFLPGHTRLLGVTDKFNCPNTCDIADDLVFNGMLVGNLEPGQTVEIGFKVTVNPADEPAPTVAPTAAPTAQPTVAPTAAPTVAPTQAPSNNVRCPDGTIFSRIEGNNIICINNVNNNTNTSNSGGNTQTVNVTAPSSAPQEIKVLAAGTSTVKELPNTGLPLAGLALAGLTPVGLKLRRMGKSNLESLTPDFIWNQREFEKEA